LNKHEIIGKPHQDCPYHIALETVCYCKLEGHCSLGAKCYLRQGLSCYDCYHGYMTEKEVREMDD